MNNLTGREIAALRMDLEKSAAALLGQMLFEFARLDAATGMCVSWLDEGRQLTAFTKRAEGLTFHERLRCIGSWLDENPPASDAALVGYRSWIAGADAIRQKRNELVHGRWWIDPERLQIVNVLGLPNSPEQTERRYRLDDLEAILKEMNRLLFQLSDLRMRWPI